MKRTLDICVISDVHLGTYGCQAKQLYNYLKSIKPKILILNGDILDVWQFKSRYFPKFQQKILFEIFKKSRKGTKVIYLTGNHDSFLRQYPQLKEGDFQLRNHYSLELADGKALFLHGDKYDFSVQSFPILSKIGSIAYDQLVWLNTLLNKRLNNLGMRNVKFSKLIKSLVKQAVKFINDYEHEIIRRALIQGYKYVICGHVHSAKIEKHTIDGKSIYYLNSGDWVESMTSLEYHKDSWSIYSYDALEFKIDCIERKAAKEINKTNKEEKRLIKLSSKV